MAGKAELNSVPTFYPAPIDFRAWLKKNHNSESIHWVGCYKKATGKQSVTWEETVDEALCYGWIDGVRRGVDDESYMIRFSHRKPKSVWSRRNIERVKVLKAAGRMRKAGLDAYVFKEVHTDSGYAVGDRPATLPAEMMAEFKKHIKAWAFYESQPVGYHKQTTAWVTSAKREETRQRRLATLIDDSADGLRIKQLRRK
ncbi:MAG: bacteriocin-protection protein [Planctomycetes bacterium]|nr:bacteriocin-protection protein [Planctomycetota bacterium]MCP4770121.1 bacteriocin-protection protein [Planctomycetota bacterium]MCP4860731.1 bacteriocin-protection protein [Planctomycetota bacterium]